jgi:hypothetical protein
MNKLFSLFLLFVSVFAFAQNGRYNFQTTIQGGMLEGEGGGAFQLQTINGFQHKTWFAGIGAGLDYYHVRSIPVFLNVRKALLNNEKTPFLYLNGGYHFPWLKEGDKLWHITETSGGFYYDAGIGYQLPVMKKSSLFFTAGFSQKNYSQKGTDGVWIAIWPWPGPQQTRLYEYNLRRLSIQSGIRF